MLVPSIFEGCVYMFQTVDPPPSPQPRGGVVGWLGRGLVGWFRAPCEGGVGWLGGWGVVWSWFRVGLGLAYGCLG